MRPTYNPQNNQKQNSALPELQGVYLNRDRQLPMGVYQEDPAFDALHIRVRDQVGGR